MREMEVRRRCIFDGGSSIPLDNLTGDWDLPLRDLCARPDFRLLNMVRDLGFRNIIEKH